MIAILILAAGRAARMRGGDKLLEEVDGAPCLTVLCNRALASGAEVFAVIPDGDHPRATALPARVRPVPAPDADLGMAHSIRAGIAALPPGTEAAMILPGDMPEIETADMQAMIAAFSTTPSQILQAATQDGAPGHPILFASTLFPEFETLTGDTGARRVIEAHRADWTLFPLPGQRARQDLDTPEDWAAWRASQSREP